MKDPSSFVSLGKNLYSCTRLELAWTLKVDIVIFIMVEIFHIFPFGDVCSLEFIFWNLLTAILQWNLPPPCNFCLLFLMNIEIVLFLKSLAFEMNVLEFRIFVCWGDGGSSMCTHVCRPKVDVGNLLDCSSTLFSEEESPNQTKSSLIS